MAFTLPDLIDCYVSSLGQYVVVINRFLRYRQYDVTIEVAKGHEISFRKHKMNRIISRAIFSALTIALIVLAAPAQTLTAEERKIAEQVDRLNAEALSLIERTVNIESPTEDIKGGQGRRRDNEQRARVDRFFYKMDRYARRVKACRSSRG